MENKNKNARIQLLIERYFDATASEAEERELRLALADPALSGKEIDEARAVLGYFAVARDKSTPDIRRRNYRPAIAAAITLALVCAAALPLIFSGHAEQNTCIAYIGGRQIVDQAKVIGLMNSDLEMLGDASAAMKSDFQSQISALSEEFVDI